MAGVGSEPTISACPRSEARRSHGKDADASKAAYRTESLNPMSAALCPAKPPGLTLPYRDNGL